MTPADTTAPLVHATLDLPGVRHGFFTRAGGVSTGIYAGLNCGPGSDDTPAAVAENRRRVAEALGADDLATAHQVHGADAAVAAPGWTATTRPRVDALVTDRPGQAVGVLAADCAPVLFADTEAGVVGAAHAGWRGALDGVLASAVGAMERLGARRGRIAAVLGPCIRQPSYQVGPEFPAPFLAQDPAHAAFFASWPDAPDRWAFDLAGYVRARLAALGLAAVADVAADTYPDADRFFSYRRSTHRGAPDYGRQVSAIAVAVPD